MERDGLVRMLGMIAMVLVLAALAFATHPGWFRNTPVFTLPQVARTPTIGPTAQPSVKRATPTPTTPLVGMTQHLDDIWVTPFQVDRSQGAHGVQPNLGDEFLIVHVAIRNRSQTNFAVRLDSFQVLDSHGQIDPPLTDNFTRRRLREVRLIPAGYTQGTLVFEVPLHDPAPTLIFAPEALDPSKTKEWLLR